MKLKLKTTNKEQVSTDEKLLDGNIPKAEIDAQNVILRSCGKGTPEMNDGGIRVHKNHYIVETN